METTVLVFDTTHAALWAEEVAEGAGVPVDVIPAPAESRARCDLALVVRRVDQDRLTDALRRVGVSFRTWDPPS